MKKKSKVMMENKIKCMNGKKNLKVNYQKIKIKYKINRKFVFNKFKK